METNLGSELSRAVVDARRRLNLPTMQEPPRHRRTGPSVRPSGQTVLLATRVPSALRRRVHEAAAATGASSVQEWVNAVLSAATDQALTPEGRMAGILAGEARRALGSALDDGTYQLVAGAVEDPDLV